MISTRAQQAALAFSLALMGLVGGIWGVPVPVTDTGGWPAAAIILVHVAGVIFAVTTLACVDPRSRRLAWCCLAATLAALIPVIYLPLVLKTPADATAWVALAEVLVFAFSAAGWAAASARNRNRVRLGLSLVSGAAVAGFGAVHLAYPQAISALLVEGFPFAETWPYLTGAVQVIAGALILSGWRRWPAGLIALMFASWIFVVHLPRIAADPDSAGEWSALAIAIALSASLWTVARTPNGIRRLWAAPVEG